MRPVIVHQRLDFMIYSLDAIANWLSGYWPVQIRTDAAGVPVTIRAIVGKGWGQGPQHSKSLHAWFGHLPGLRVAVPSTAYDAKGLLLESIFGEDPTIIIEHRSLFSMTDEVPEIPYRVRFGRSQCRQAGEDVTIACLGMMVPLALRAAEQLACEGISAGECPSTSRQSARWTSTECAPRPERRGGWSWRTRPGSRLAWRRKSLLACANESAASCSANPASASASPTATCADEPHPWSKNILP